MQTYELEDNKYYYNNGKWLTSSFTTPPLAVVSKLNKLLINQEDFSQKTMDELLEIIDRSRASENIQLAAQAIEAALRIATLPELRSLLPRLTSNYRKIGRAKSAIEIADSYLEEYGRQLWSPALFTSLAAAYCDLDDYEKGKHLADRARSISGTEASPELVSVYKRIKQHNEE